MPCRAKIQTAYQRPWLSNQYRARVNPKTIVVAKSACYAQMPMSQLTRVYLKAKQHHTFDDRHARTPVCCPTTYEKVLVHNYLAAFPSQLEGVNCLLRFPSS